MRAIIYDGFGGIDVIKVKEIAVPQPSENEVLIRVRAAGINRSDLLQRKGSYPPPPGVTDIPGLEVSGEVTEAGNSSFKKGDKVCALVPGGGYAEYVTVDKRNVTYKPNSLSWEEGAGLMETFMTVWGHLFHFAGFTEGKSILIHGGASGIGTTAIPLAKIFGASQIFTTVSNEDHEEACRRLGADVTINYENEDFVEIVNKYTSGKGCDFILDIIGGSYVQRNYEAAAIYGRVLQVGLMQDKVKELDLFPMLSKRITHLGITLRSQSIEQKGKIIQSLEKNVWPLIENQKLKPSIDRIFTLKETREAQKYFENGKHFGKVILINEW